eukprot:TRINITY_DN4187_c0_g1_i2.p1 TRINITY_DN4187_c0_g1~~TRINITY_DN4187_c0_g1_i2.p1  ORF type:complete len:185 (-),score=41.71 TRINITY_DN4187_c0_g1_i2:422-976(-)
MKMIMNNNPSSNSSSRSNNSNNNSNNNAIVSTERKVARTTCIINEFNKIYESENEHQIKLFEFLGVDWNLLIFPKGNDVENMIRAKGSAPHNFSESSPNWGFPMFGMLTKLRECSFIKNDKMVLNIKIERPPNQATLEKNSTSNWKSDAKDEARVSYLKSLLLILYYNGGVFRPLPPVEKFAFT